jgi:hypothetical protein
MLTRRELGIGAGSLENAGKTSYGTGELYIES